MLKLQSQVLRKQDPICCQSWSYNVNPVHELYITPCPLLLRTLPKSVCSSASDADRATFILPFSIQCTVPLLHSFLKIQIQQ